MNKPSRISPEFAIGLLLALVTLAIFWPVADHDFVNYDDNLYVTDNLKVEEGLTFNGVAWAFTTLEACNWHPLTWLSHMLDVTLYGQRPGGHHVTNVLFHVANALLLFLLMKRMTGALLPAAFVAALFAWHPLHVESVAWIAERKDVLSTFFLLLTLMAYARFAAEGRRRLYFLALGLFALGLMAKPMLVTLPCLLLLLDYWPLGRMRAESAGAGGAAPGFSWHSCSLRIREKIPFFALTVASSALTFWAQRRSGAMQSFDLIPLPMRAVNATAAYVGYLAKMIWPVDLAVLYPLPPSLPIGQVIASAAALLAITAAVVWRKDRPFLTVGWLWYLGTLVPVIGLIQVGGQAMADRYSYVPFIGVFIMVAWTGTGCVARWPKCRPALAVLAGLALLGCILQTGLHLRTWRNSITLFQQTLRVTQNNILAHNNLAAALNRAGSIDEALAHYRESVRLDPDFKLGHYNLAINLTVAGRLDEAMAHWSNVVRLRMDTAEKLNVFGVTLAQQGYVQEAVAQFSGALRRDPNYPKAHYNLGFALAGIGRSAEAIAQYRAAVRLEPEWPDALQSLAWILATHEDAEFRNGAEAVELAERLCRLTRQENPAHLDTLAAAYAEAGRFSEAAATARKAAELARKAELKELPAQIEKRLQLFDSGQPYREAPKKHIQKA